LFVFVFCLLLGHCRHYGTHTYYISGIYCSAQKCDAACSIVRPLLGGSCVGAFMTNALFLPFSVNGMVVFHICTQSSIAVAQWQFAIPPATPAADRVVQGLVSEAGIALPLDAHLHHVARWQAFGEDGMLILIGSCRRIVDIILDLYAWQGGRLCRF
jgi:hypothetical protein